VTEENAVPPIVTKAIAATAKVTFLKNPLRGILPTVLID